MSNQIKATVYRLAPIVLLVITIAAPRKWDW